MFKGDIPDKGTKQWVANEKTINNTGMLKKARDQSEGFNTANKKYGSSHGGKGSAMRPSNQAAYASGWDKIFGKTHDSD